MKQYRLKKDLPGVKAGAIFGQHKGFSGFVPVDGKVISLEVTFSSYTVENNPDWFEPVRWRPEAGDWYYCVSTSGNVEKYKFWKSDYKDEGSYEFGNCFKTREEAEAARDKVRELLLSLPND